MRGLVQKPMLGDECMSDGTNPGDRNNAGKWLMNEGSGNTVADLSGNRHNGTFANTPVWAAGKYGSALDFQANDAVNMTLTSKLTIATTQPVTVVAWVKTASAATNCLCFWGGASRPAFYLQWSTTKPIIYMSSGHYRFFAAAAVGIITDGNWHQVVFIYTGNTTTSLMYLDGVQVGDGGDTSGGTGVEAPSKFQICASTIVSGIPTVDHLLYINRILLASEIAQLYREPFCDLGPRMMNLYVPAAAGGTILPQITAAYTRDAA